MYDQGLKAVLLDINQGGRTFLTFSSSLSVSGEVVGEITDYTFGVIARLKTPLGHSIIAPFS